MPVSKSRRKKKLKAGAQPPTPPVQQQEPVETENEIDRWEKLRESEPDQPVGYQRGAMALRQAGRFDEAETVASVGIERFPDDLGIAHEYCRVALGRGDHSEALTRALAMIGRFPDEEAGYLTAALALRGSQRFE